MKRSVWFASFVLLSLLCGCESMEEPDNKDYDRQQGLTTVTHGDVRYKFYAEKRKLDNQTQVAIELLSDNTSICVQDCRSGIDPDGVEWFVVYFEAKHKRDQNVTDHFIDNVSVKVAAVDKFSQKGTLGGTIPAVKGNIALVYKGAVSFEDNFKLKYFKEDMKNPEPPKVQSQPTLETPKPKQ